jgi:trimeric autotransporter adhesin
MVGGGMFNSATSNPIVTNCIFNCNLQSGMYNDTSNPIITNCVFNGNSNSGMYNNSSNPSITNCTFSANSANKGGGIFNSSSSPTITNCILWKNTASQDAQIYNFGTSSPIITYCDIEGGWTGAGNINTDPLFWDADGADNIIGTNDDDLRLLPYSPCIDAGNNTAVPVGITTDFYSNPRIIDGDKNGIAKVDIGVYESPPTIFVDDTAAGALNGRSWTNAYTHLQDALNSAVTGDNILVAAGTYYPSNQVGGTGQRYAAFQMKNGVAIYGGFPDGGGSWMQRDWQTHKAILSGDLGMPDYDDDNAYHVFYHPNYLDLNSTAVLDGFTITGGTAYGLSPHDCGGGMYNDSGIEPYIINCTFTGNTAVYGGGIYNDFSNPAITNCAFVNNTGHGIYNDWFSSPAITHCTFTGNSGGGLANSTQSNPTIYNCIFTGNGTFGSLGGGIFNLDSSPIVINCAFKGNRANQGGGICNYDSNPSVINCSFAGNSAFDRGGAIYDSNNTTTIINCILWNDTPDEIYCLSYPNVSYSDVKGGFDGTGNIDTDPRFIDAASADLRLDIGSPCIDQGNNSAIQSSNTSDPDGNPRIIDGDRNGTSIVDMGCDEFKSPIFVDDTAVGTNNGFSWADAYQDLQDALDTSAPGDWIWVAAGTYHPSVMVGGSELNCTTFQMKNGVEICGGFFNGGSSWAWRKPSIHQTILSGDPNTPGNIGDNAYHVFYHPDGLGLNKTAILDGFTITAGNAFGMSPHYYGGGIYNNNNSPTIINCTFYGNSGYISGGGIYNYYSNPTITNCLFSSNSTNTYGGGIYNFASRPIVTNCTFSQNLSTSGGGMYNSSSSPTIKNCIFWGNTPNQVYNISSNPAVTYSDVQGGYSGTGNINTDPLFANVIGGNLRLSFNSPCIDAGNNSAVPVGIIKDLSGLPRFSNTCRPDTGSGTPPIVDMGPYEFQAGAGIDGRGSADMRDFTLLAAQWLQTACGLCNGADLTCDGNVDLYDLKELADYWLVEV